MPARGAAERSGGTTHTRRCPVSRGPWCRPGRASGRAAPRSAPSAAGSPAAPSRSDACITLGAVPEYLRRSSICSRSGTCSKAVRDSLLGPQELPEAAGHCTRGGSTVSPAASLAGSVAKPADRMPTARTAPCRPAAVGTAVWGGGGVDGRVGAGRGQGPAGQLASGIVDAAYQHGAPRT